MLNKFFTRECALCVHSFISRIPCGDIIGSALTGSAQVTSAALTNQANIQMNKETNQANRDIARQTNEANIQMNEENNRLQMQLQQEMNEYNSLSSQLQRAQDAGVNPNAVLGGNVQGNLQQTLPTTHAGHAEIGAPMQPVQMQSPLQSIADVFNSYFDNLQKQEQAKLTESQKTNQEIINQFQERLSLSGVRVNEATIAQLYSQAEQNSAMVRSLDKSVQKMNKEIDKYNEETIGLHIDNYFKSELYQHQIKTLESQCNFNNAQAIYALSVLPSVIGLNHAQTFNAIAQGRLAGAMKSLTEKQKAYVNQQLSYLTIATGQEALDFLINSDEDVIQSKKESLKNAPVKQRQEIEDLKYKNSDLYRFIQGAKDVVIGIGAGIGSAVMIKGMKGKTPRKPELNGGLPEQNTTLNPSEVGPTYW